MSFEVGDKVKLNADYLIIKIGLGDDEGGDLARKNVLKDMNKEAIVKNIKEHGKFPIEVNRALARTHLFSPEELIKAEEV